MKKEILPTIVDWIVFAVSDGANSSRNKIMKNKEGVKEKITQSNQDFLRNVGTKFCLWNDGIAIIASALVFLGNELFTFRKETFTYWLVCHSLEQKKTWVPYHFRPPHHLPTPPQLCWVDTNYNVTWKFIQVFPYSIHVLLGPGVEPAWSNSGVQELFLCACAASTHTDTVSSSC